MLLRHPANGTTTATFLDGCLQGHLLETGTEFGLFQQCYDNTAILATNTWMKRVWKDLDHMDLHLEFDSPSLPLQRQGDQLLMSAFVDAEIDQDDLMWLNWCRMYLQVISVSDLVTADGRSFTRSAWFGKRPLIPERLSLVQWPRSVDITDRHWNRWRHFLTTIFTRGPKSRRLRIPLGDWTDDISCWKWLYSPSQQSLYQRQGHGWIKLVRSSTFNPRKPLFLRPLFTGFLDGPLLFTGFLDGPLPLDSQRASIERMKLARPIPGLQVDCRIQVTGVGSEAPPPPGIGSTVFDRWHDLESKISDTLGWIPEEIKITGDEQQLVQALRDGRIRVVSDGSFKDGVGSAAAQILTLDRKNIIWIMCQTPGLWSDQSPYRSELIGILTGVVVVGWLRDACRLGPRSNPPAVGIACDGLTAIQQAFGSGTLKSSQKQFDLLSTIRTVSQSIKVSWEDHHVKGHEDDRRALNTLDWWELRNVECDGQARIFRLRLLDSQRLVASNRRFFSEPASLFIHGVKQSRVNPAAVMELVTLPPLLEYWSRRDRLHTPAFNEVDWSTNEVMMRNLPSGIQRWLTKHCVGMCGVGKWRLRWHLDPRNECPRCGQEEDAHHVPRCPNPAAEQEWNDRLSSLRSWMQKEDTATDLAEAILQLLRVVRSPASNQHVGRYIHSQHRASLLDAIRSQQIIGAQCLLEGLLSTRWAALQQDHFERRQSRRTGSKWAARLSAQIVMIGFHMWQHRNNAQHSDSNVQLRFRHRDVNLGIREQYTMGHIDLPAHASRMLRRARHDLLKLPLIDRECWLRLIRRERVLERRAVDKLRSTLYEFTHSVRPPLRPIPPQRTYTDGATRVARYHQSHLVAPLVRPPIPRQTPTNGTTRVVRYAQSTLQFRPKLP